MSLEVNEVARLVAVAGVKEMIEADLKQRCQRGIGRDVTTDSRVFLVLTMHHRHGIPASQAFHAPLELAIAGIWDLLFDGNGVDVRSIELDGNFHAGSVGVLDQGLDQFASPGGAFLSDNLVESLNPFRDFFVGLHLRLARKFQYAVIDFLSCHPHLDDARNARSPRRASTRM